MSRLIAKSLSYRAASMLTTLVVGYAVTGSATVALSIGLAGSVVKLGLFAGHEWLWDRFSPAIATTS